MFPQRVMSAYHRDPGITIMSRSPTMNLEPIYFKNCSLLLFIICMLLCSTSFISIKFSQKNISRYNFRFLQSQLYDSLKHSPPSLHKGYWNEFGKFENFTKIFQLKWKKFKLWTLILFISTVGYLIIKANKQNFSLLDIIIILHPFKSFLYTFSSVSSFL